MIAFIAFTCSRVKFAVRPLDRTKQVNRLAGVQVTDRDAVAARLAEATARDADLANASRSDHQIATAGIGGDLLDGGDPLVLGHPGPLGRSDERSGFRNRLRGSKIRQCRILIKRTAPFDARCANGRGRPAAYLRSFPNRDQRLRVERL